MAGRAKENFPGGSLKYMFVYLKVRIFKCSYRINIYIYIRITSHVFADLCKFHMSVCRDRLNLQRYDETCRFQILIYSHLIYSYLLVGFAVDLQGTVGLHGLPDCPGISEGTLSEPQREVGGCGLGYASEDEGLQGDQGYRNIAVYI